jgi:hypothetical protein
MYDPDPRELMIERLVEERNAERRGKSMERERLQQLQNTRQAEKRDSDAKIDALVSENIQLKDLIAQGDRQQDANRRCSSSEARGDVVMLCMLRHGHGGPHFNGEFDGGPMMWVDREEVQEDAGPQEPVEAEESAPIAVVPAEGRCASMMMSDPPVRCERELGHPGNCGANGAEWNVQGAR